MVPALIGRVHVTGIPWEERCPLSQSHHLCGKGIRRALRGTFQQPRPHLPCLGELPPAGKSWGADGGRQPAALQRPKFRIRSQDLSISSMDT